MAAQPEQFLYESHSAVLLNVVVSGTSLASLVKDIRKLYLLDDRPWIIGFSGGKDSTAVLSLVFSAIQGLGKAKRRHKRVYVVSSDTLVETPVIANHMQNILRKIEEIALSDNMPFSSHTVYPRKEESFWVNLLGKGYPAPSVKFRWCTERMKINPVSEFITSRVLEHGEVVVVLGSRRKESSTRAQAIAKHSIKGSVFGRHVSLPNAYTYMPIEDWSADEVWEYLMSGSVLFQRAWEVMVVKGKKDYSKLVN